MLPRTCLLALSPQHHTPPDVPAIAHVCPCILACQLSSRSQKSFTRTFRTQRHNTNHTSPRKIHSSKYSNTERTPTKLIITTPLPNVTAARKADSRATQSKTCPLSKAPTGNGKQRVHVPIQPRPSQLQSSALAPQQACFEMWSLHLQAAHCTKRHKHITLPP
jgi:hypothetical protein